MKKLFSNLHYTFYGIKLSFSGNPLHYHDVITVDSANKDKNIPTFKNDKANLKSDGDRVIIDFKKSVEEKLAECDVNE